MAVRLQMDCLPIDAFADDDRICRLKLRCRMIDAPERPFRSPRGAIVSSCGNIECTPQMRGGNWQEFSDFHLSLQDYADMSLTANEDAML